MKRPVLTLLTLLLMSSASLLAEGITTYTARRVRSGATLPATCTPFLGEVFWLTTATPTVGLYTCPVANTWALVAPAGSLTAHINATSVHGATGLNTPSRIVIRDAGGNFVATTITAALAGNAQTASALAADPTDCTLPNVALGVNASGAAQCSQPSNVTGSSATVTSIAGHASTELSDGPALGPWRNYAFSYTNTAFKVASTTATITIQALGANSVMEGVEIDATTVFAGPGITTAICTIGDGTTADIYAPAYDLLAAVTDTNLWSDGGAFSPRKSAHNAVLTCTANVNWGNGSATVLTQGVLNIDLKYATRH